MPYVPDNYDAFSRHEADAEDAYQRWLSTLPICSSCNKPIKDDHCFEIGGELFCEHCIDENRVCTSNYYDEE